MRPTIAEARERVRQAELAPCAACVRGSEAWPADHRFNGSCRLSRRPTAMRVALQESRQQNQQWETILREVTARLDTVPQAIRASGLTFDMDDEDASELVRDAIIRSARDFLLRFQSGSRVTVCSVCFKRPGPLSFDWTGQLRCCACLRDDEDA